MPHDRTWPFDSGTHEEFLTRNRPVLAIARGHMLRLPHLRMDLPEEFESLRVEHGQLEREFALLKSKKPVDLAAHRWLLARLHAHRGRLADWLRRSRATHWPQ